MRRVKRWSRRHFLLSGAAALSVLVPSGWGTVHLATRPPYPERLYQAGVKDYLAGRWRSAADRFTTLIELTGESNEVLFARGAAEMQDGNYDRAATDFSKIYFDNRDSLAGECFAYSSAKVPDHKVAATAYAVLAQDVPNKSALFRLRAADCWLAIENYSEAAQCAMEVVAADPNNGVAYYFCATARAPRSQQLQSELGDKTRAHAIADIDRAIELMPDDPLLLCEAVSLYCRLNELDPDRIKNLLERAVASGVVRERLRRVGVAFPWTDQPWFLELLERCPDVQEPNVSALTHVLQPPDASEVEARVMAELTKSLPKSQVP
jgi:tetratricopeptide (TPR) repeat protein